MNGIVAISIIAAVALFAIAAKPATIDGMEESPVSIENVRRGVQNGWYTAVLLKIDGIPAVRLSGKTTDGELYSGVYPIAAMDWETLKAEGYPVSE